MFKRGDVIQRTDNGWVGVVEWMEADNYGKVIWFYGRNPPSSGGYFFSIDAHEPVTPITGYEFEAALALGDTVKALELYRVVQSRADQLAVALTPFARFGKLKRPYADGAIFTIAYDREGHDVCLYFEDFTRAVNAMPDVQREATGEAAKGSAGGIAEIMEQST